MNISPNTEIYLSLGTICAVIVFIATLTSRYISFKDKVENKIEQCKAEFEDLKIQVKEVTMKQQNTDLVIMEIKTKLSGIEAMLIDIQKDMKTIRSK